MACSIIASAIPLLMPAQRNLLGGAKELARGRHAMAWLGRRKESALPLLPLAFRRPSFLEAEKERECASCESCLAIYNDGFARRRRRGRRQHFAKHQYKTTTTSRQKGRAEKLSHSRRRNRGRGRKLTAWRGELAGFLQAVAHRKDN